LDRLVTPSREALPAHVSAWIDEREYLVEIVRRAAETDQYFCRIEVSESGLALYRQANVLRAVCKFMALRARVQAERRDLAGFLESLRLADCAGRHARKQPTRVGQIMAIACRALPQEWILIPFEWEDADSAQLLEYARAVAELCEEIPTPAGIWQTDLEIDAWMVSRQVTGFLEWVVPASRVRGEMLERIVPFHQLAAGPVEDWVDPGNANRQSLLQERATPTILSGAMNVPGWVGSFFSDQMGRSNARQLDLDARLIATQRGNRAALAVWEYKLTNARWPDSLEMARGDLPHEPYTRRPYVYRVNGDEMTLYAAGADRDDDGGWHDLRFGLKRDDGVSPIGPPDGDYVFWPIQEPCREDD
jgi:hypothetical protein